MKNYTTVNSLNMPIKKQVAEWIKTQDTNTSCLKRWKIKTHRKVKDGKKIQYANSIKVGMAIL